MDRKVHIIIGNISDYTTTCKMQNAEIGARLVRWDMSESVHVLLQINDFG